MSDFLKNIFRISAVDASESASWYTTKIIASSVLILGLFFAVTFFQTSFAMILILGALLQFLIGLPLCIDVLTRFKDCGSKIIYVLLALGSFTLTAYLFWTGEHVLETTQFITLTLLAALAPYMALICDYYADKLTACSADTKTDLGVLRPKTALKKVGTQFVEVARDEIKVDDVIKVPSGTLIPCDGKIIIGTTSVDESGITGEFRPLFKSVGDSVTGATLNRDSELTIKSTKPIADNTLEKLITLTATQTGRNLTLYKRMASATTSVAFVGIVLAAAVGTCYFLFFSTGFVQAVSLYLSVLAGFSILAYPQAFLILIHEVFDGLLKKGIVIRNTDALEKLARLKTLFIDKTGTLTRGNFDYSQMFIEMGTNQGQFLTTVFSLEMQSAHPLAKSMDKHPWYNEITKLPVRDVEIQPGLGICGTIQPRAHREYFAAIGNLRLLKRMQMVISRDMKAKADELEVMGETVLLCGYDRQVRGLVSFADSLRPKVRDTLKKLQKLKIEPALITGDSEEGLAHLSNHLGIKKVYSRCTPEEKAAKIAREVNDGAIVGFLGTRGDSNASGKAHASITLATGSDFSDITSDAIIMGENFTLVADVFKSLKKGLNKMQLLTALGLAATVLTASAGAFGLVNAVVGLGAAFGINLLILRQVKHTKVLAISPQPELHTSSSINLPW